MNHALRGSKGTNELNECAESPDTTVLEEAVGERENGGKIAPDGEERERRGEGQHKRRTLEGERKYVCVRRREKVCVCSS